ncbi:DUF4360 domain-containing protein (plasmid) [Kitasatospora sp. NBC_00070]|uniref:DUF4360 domain-containing protein n=1 Tax=Kitasatospora sp. NBC_00070 TaxID=2975962 RepID=UPI002F90F744
MALRASILTAGVLLATLAGTALPAQAATVLPANPPADHIVIDVASVNGSGCPTGTAAVTVADDNTAFTVTYSDYLAQVGPNSLPTDLRKNCQVNLDVHVPQGFTYAIASADYRGFAHLEPGASALQRANYYFQGSPQTVTSTHRFQGPLDDNWQATDSVGVAALVWAPCGEKRNFNINTELRVAAGTSNRNATSFMTMDSTDGGINTIYQLAWKTCP